jgi:hypothetical protein
VGPHHFRADGLRLLVSGGDPADLGEHNPSVIERRLIYADELAL